MVLTLTGISKPYENILQSIWCTKTKVKIPIPDHRFYSSLLSTKSTDWVCDKTKFLTKLLTQLFFYCQEEQP